MTDKNRGLSRAKIIHCLIPLKYIIVIIEKSNKTKLLVVFRVDVIGIISVEKCSEVHEDGKEFLGAELFMLVQWTRRCCPCKILSSSLPKII